ncbi:MAG TPA: FliM/FliN family flagellar motor switch protein [Acidimicrobiales bacterium]|nr:FliM/FliN family flagellar motor switch protein [Acidimicrobiales bacterium]
MTLVDESQRQVRPYDFQRQEGLERGRLRRLVPVLEVVAHRIAGYLTSVLHQPVRMEVGEVEQMRWERFANDLPEPTILTSATVAPFGGRIVLHLPLPLAYRLVEIRLGGAGTTEGPERPPTEIEQRLVSEVAVGALEELPPAFAGVISMSLGGLASVASPMLLHGAKPTEMCLIIALRLELGEAGSHETRICVPLTVLIPVLDALERIDRVQGRGDSERALEGIRERLLEAPVETSVCFPEFSLMHNELAGLMPGDVVRLRRRVGSPLLMCVGGSAYCDVVPTNRGKRLACMVVESEQEIQR